MNLIIFIACICVAIAILVFIVRKQQQKSALRPALITAILGLALAGGLFTFVVQQGSKLPQATLLTMQDETGELTDYFDGRPMVVNLWASWCPPCVREMPMLQAAEKNHTNIRFIFINQREHVDVINQFLNNTNLELETVLRDASGDFSAAVGAHVMPTTLFFSADGKLQKRFYGEVDESILNNGLERITTPE